MEKQIESNPGKMEETTEILAKGILDIYQPHLLEISKELKELIAKQNIIYLHLSAEKFKFSTEKMDQKQQMMEKAKLYKDKLLTIKKHITSIHQRTKMLQKRSQNIQNYCEKDATAKLHKRLKEESLIRTDNVSTTTNTPS